MNRLPLAVLLGRLVRQAVRVGRGQVSLLLGVIVSQAGCSFIVASFPGGLRGQVLGVAIDSDPEIAWIS